MAGCQLTEACRRYHNHWYDQREPDRRVTISFPLKFLVSSSIRHQEQILLSLQPMRMDITVEVSLLSSHTVMWYSAFFGIGFTHLVHAILSVVTFGWIQSPSVKYLNELESFSTVVMKGGSSQ